MRGNLLFLHLSSDSLLLARWDRSTRIKTIAEETLHQLIPDFSHGVCLTDVELEQSYRTVAVMKTEAYTLQSEVLEDYTDDACNSDDC